MSDSKIETLESRLDRSALPKHVAIILDGNGRWARQRGLGRSEGHKAGAATVDRLLEYYLTLGIPYISLYTFSTENWKRPAGEIAAIWRLLNEFFEKRLEFCREKGIRIRVSGNINALPSDSRKIVKKAIEETSGGKSFTVNFCINYGARAEILHAANEILKERMRYFRKGKLRAALKKINEAEFEKYFYTYPLPDVDILIRPGGEKRVSNYMLWQIAYAEIRVIDVLWPDFTEIDLLESLIWYQNRNRRFGGLNESGEME
jgi:undecaprenyl diphosphate synthase